MIRKFPFYLYNSFLLILISAASFAQAPQTKQKKQAATPKTSKTASTKLKSGPVRIKISTDSGTIIIALSDSTPFHRDNFVKLVKEGFYDSLLFHRVIPAFMIQGGDPTSKNAEPGATMGNGGSEMTRIPAEFNPALYHKKGALAAARDDNPQKASSACQFYIVEGKIYTDELLNMFDQLREVKYTPEQREIYKTIGGTPQLDTKYTVFGEVESGLDVIGKISHVTRDPMNRPLGNVRMKMEIIN